MNVIGAFLVSEKGFKVNTLASVIVTDDLLHQAPFQQSSTADGQLRNLPTGKYAISL